MVLGLTRADCLFGSVIEDINLALPTHRALHTRCSSLNQVGFREKLNSLFSPPSSLPILSHLQSQTNFLLLSSPSVPIILIQDSKSHPLNPLLLHYCPNLSQNSSFSARPSHHSISLSLSLSLTISDHSGSTRQTLSLSAARPLHYLSRPDPEKKSGLAAQDASNTTTPYRAETPRSKKQKGASHREKPCKPAAADCHHGRPGVSGTRQPLLQLLLQGRGLRHARLLRRELQLPPVPVVEGVGSLGGRRPFLRDPTALGRPHRSAPGRAAGWASRS